MPKINLIQFHEIIASPDFQEILEIISSFENKEELLTFFRAAFSEKEIENFKNRWQAVKWIGQEDLTYREIIKRTGLSSTILQRARSRILNPRYEWDFFLKKSKGLDIDPLQELFEILSSITDKKEIEFFFSNALTTTEVFHFNKRWQVVKMIKDEIPYRTISKETGVALSTIHLIAKSLKENTGWNLALEKLNKR